MFNQSWSEKPAPYHGQGEDDCADSRPENAGLSGELLHGMLQFIACQSLTVHLPQWIELNNRAGMIHSLIWCTEYVLFIFIICYPKNLISFILFYS